MSKADTSQSLGPPRLSVRESEIGDFKPSDTEKSTFADSLDFEEIALTGETEYRSVSADDSRRIESVADGVDAFEDYLKAKENASLVLEEQDSGDVRVLPYNHRWTSEYRNMVYAKLSDAERRLDEIFGDGPIPTTMLSLTAHQTDSEGYPRPLGEVLEDLLGGWDKFRRVIRRATEGYRTEYVRVVEPHESGYPHIHVAIFGVAKPSLQQKVRELWVDEYDIGGEKAHENAVEIERGRTAQVENVSAYLMKYLGKTTVRETGEQQQVGGFKAFAALLWVTGKRQFSASEALSEAMTPESGGGSGEGNWRFVGVAHGVNTGRYEGDEARELLGHLESEIWRPPPKSAISGEYEQVGLKA